MTAALEPIVLFMLGALLGLGFGLMSRWSARMKAQLRWPFGTASSRRLQAHGLFPVTCPRCGAENDAGDRKEGEIQTCRVCRRNFCVPPRHDPWHTTAAAWVVVIAGLAAIVLPWWEAREERTIQTEGVRAIAKVVEKLPSRGRRQSDRLRVHFLTDQGPKTEALKVDSYLFSRIRVGTHVSIHYLAKYPSCLIISGTADDMPPQWYQVCFGFLAAGCAGVFWCRKRNRAAKRPSELPMAGRIE